jgi:predicted ArsR family transcriptional regulator
VVRPDPTPDPDATAVDADADAAVTPPSAPVGGSQSPRLEILKALGDNTRYAIYLELARSPVPLGTADVSRTLDLHVNTVRPHLERMREVGLLEVTSEARRGVGRPQHLYALAPDAPSLGLEPPSYPLLAGLLLRLVESAGIEAGEAVEVGREQGLLVAATDLGRGVDAVVSIQADLGFDPELVVDPEGTTVAFGHCPYGDLARQHSEVVCGLHCGLVEGLVEGVGGAEVRAFHTLADRAPCQVELAST